MTDIKEIEAETIAALHAYTSAMIQRALQTKTQYVEGLSDIGEKAANLLWQLQRLNGAKVSEAVASLIAAPQDIPGEPGHPFSGALA